MSPTMDVVVKTIRSILNTTKNGLSEEQLRSIYREMEGEQIPYKTFQFKTLYDFLYASNEFHLFRVRDGLYIRARLTQYSKHIVKMVNAQAKKNTKFHPLPRHVTANLTGNRSQKRLGQNQSKWNSNLKAKIKKANRMNMKREFGWQNRKVNGNRVQTTNGHTQSMLTSQNIQNPIDDTHFWLRNFFKQVRFLLKHISSNSIIYDENHIECFNELAKISVWKEIAHDYRGLVLQSDSSDAEHNQDGSALKRIQLSIQSKLNAFVKKLHHCSKHRLENSDQLNLSATFYAMDSAEQAEITDHGLIDFLQNVSFILECIVAHPALFDHNNQLHHNESIKFSIWNHICIVYYEKLQSNDFELGDEDVQFEIKYLQRTIERHLSRLTTPLAMSILAE